MDLIKEAFFRIKQEMNDMREAILSLKQEINSLKLDKNTQNNQTIPTHNQSYSNTNSDTPTHNPTHDLSFKPLKQQNMAISTGNGGVPTDRQTDRQTDKLPQIEHISTQNLPKFNDFEQAKEILDSLDNIKKGIRLKFKRLTPQEMLVFSTIYSLEESRETSEITYKQIAIRLKLSESSIRDYTNRLIGKGIPIIKTRQNNKTITLSISVDLKQIANLSTINKLRDL